MDDAELMAVAECRWREHEERFNTIDANILQVRQRLERMEIKIDSISTTVKKNGNGGLILDDELGDIRRVWRVSRWWVAALVLVLTAGVAEWLMHTFFGLP